MSSILSQSSSSSSKASSASEAETETEVAHPSTSGTSMAAQMEAMNARITLLESKMAKMERRYVHLYD